MAESYHLGDISRMGINFGGKFHSPQEGMLTNSGEDNYQLLMQKPYVSEQPETDASKIFMSSLKWTTTLDYLTSYNNTTSEILSGIRKSFESNLPVTSVKSPRFESEEDVTYRPDMDLNIWNKDSSNIVPESSKRVIHRIRLPPRLKRRMKREEKEAEGTWLPAGQWRKSLGLKPKKKKHSSTPNRDSPKVGPILLETSSSRVEKTKATAAGAGSEPSFKEQLSCMKMAIAHTAYPYVRFTEDECDYLQEKLVEMVFKDESDLVPLQILKTYPEQGTLVITCGNNETKTWLKKVASNLRPGNAENSGVVVGDYKDLLQTTKILLRTDKFSAKKDPNQILEQVQKQNPGLSTKDWRIMNIRKEENYQTLVLTVDALSAHVMNDRGWRIFLGISRVQVKVLSSSSPDYQIFVDESPAS